MTEPTDTDKIMELLTPDPWEQAEQAENAAHAVKEFEDKRQSLAMFLLALATGWTWEDADGVDHYHENYTKDAEDVLRSQPHLLSLPTREHYGLWDKALDTDEGATFEPVAISNTVGFRVSAPNLPDRWVVLNPSMAQDTGDIKDTDVFVYLADSPETLTDNPQCFINIWNEEDK
jgi:hypothetical protein